MTLSPEEAAHELLEVIPIVMRDIRSEMRSRRSPDLTIPQFRTLAFVNRNVGSSLLEVANHLGLTPPSTSRLVDGLIVRSLMTREDHPDDRRRVKLTITHLGQKILETSRQDALTYLVDKLNRINANDREVIVKAMKALQPIFTEDVQTETVRK
ncbi:MAG TPA: MarR family transcriptional regulator [Candidatus Acidoferrales bacterium]|nr:MarR family transcriptional regulator [Candidatus Acidoferrales bacterium]